MNIRATSWLSISLIIGLSLTGCQTIKGWTNKIDNGSLDYTQAKQLDPIKLPADQETASFIPLYPTPNVGKNTLQISNAEGNRYQLPPPRRLADSTTTPYSPLLMYTV